MDFSPELRLKRECARIILEILHHLNPGWISGKLGGERSIGQRRVSLRRVQMQSLVVTAPGFTDALSALEYRELLSYATKRCSDRETSRS